MTPSRRTLALALALVVALLGLNGQAASAATANVTLGGPTQAAPGETVTLLVTVTGQASPGMTVTLQRKEHGLFWKNAGATTVDDAFQATFDVTPPAEGSLQFRAVVRTGFLSSARSATHTLQVSEPAPQPSEPVPSEPVPNEPVPSEPARPAPTPGEPCAGFAPLKADASTWECTYSDEFDGTELDREFWYPQVTATSGVINGTDSMYTCYDDREDVIAVRDGNLELSMVRLPEVVDCGKGKASQYVAGQVSHFGTHSQTYGKYEIRAKFPDVRRAGLQSAIWLWPVDQSKYGFWPLSGEIDIAEHYSTYPDHAIPYMHYAAGTRNAERNQNVVTGLCAINPGEFNTYGLEWTPRQLRIFVNGELCIENNYSSWVGFLNQNAPFDHPFFLALTQMMGTTGNEYDPAVMPEKVTTQVDYVRIWQ